MKIQGKTIWVAEAGGALGTALVRALAREGNFVIASGSGGPALQGLASRSRGAVVALPPASSERAAQGVVVPFGGHDGEELGARLGEYTERLDIAVCGAAGGASAERSWGCAQTVMDRELLVPMRLIEVALPLLRRGRSPYLVCLCAAPERGEPADLVGAAGVALAGFAHSLGGPAPGAVTVSIVQRDRTLGDPERAASAILAGMARRRALIRVGRRAGALDALSIRWHARYSGSERSRGAVL